MSRKKTKEALVEKEEQPKEVTGKEIPTQGDAPEVEFILASKNVVHPFALDSHLGRLTINSFLAKYSAMNVEKEIDMFAEKTVLAPGDRVLVDTGVKMKSIGLVPVISPIEDLPIMFGIDIQSTLFTDLITNNFEETKIRIMVSNNSKQSFELYRHAVIAYINILKTSILTF